MNTEIRYSNGMEYLWNFGMEWNGILKIWNTIRIFGQYSGILFEYWKKGDTQKYQEKWYSSSIQEY